MSLDQNILNQARRRVELEYPEESEQHKAAFANSVYYFVTGWSGGYGGPSVREHAAGRYALGVRYLYEDAVQFLLDPYGPIFGPITELHEDCWREEYCFNDDPADVAELVERTGLPPKA